MLTTILLGKMKQNMARAHGKREWSIAKLRAFIHNELYILEIGAQTIPHAALPPTASFHSSVSEPTHSHSSAGKATCPKERYSAPFSRAPHSASLCENFKDPRQIVHQERLCFNCLGHHKISSCNSKHKCHYCQ